MRAILRLIKISLISVLALYLVFLGLRVIGLQRSFSAFEHPLLLKPKLVIFPFSSEKQLYASRLLPETYLPLLECYFLRGTWEVRFAKGESLTLKQLLKKFSKKRDMVLKVLSLEHQGLSQLVELLKNNSAIDRVIITSPLAQITRELRKLAPQLLFLGHFKEISQLSVMSILSIESLASLQSDIYSIPLDKFSFFSKEILEIQRRKKKVILLYRDREAFRQRKELYDGSILEPSGKS